MHNNPFGMLANYHDIGEIHEIHQRNYDISKKQMELKKQQMELKKHRLVYTGHINQPNPTPEDAWHKLNFIYELYKLKRSNF